MKHGDWWTVFDQEHDPRSFPVKDTQPSLYDGETGINVTIYVYFIWRPRPGVSI